MQELKTVGDQARSEYLPLVERAGFMSAAIVDAESYEAAALLYQEVKARIKKVGEILDPFVQMAHKTWKTAVAKRAEYLDPLERAEASLKPALALYQAEQEKIRQAEQRRLEEANRAAAEEERIKDALALVEAGDKESANAILNQPIVVAPVFAPAAIPHIKGMFFRDNWQASVVDIKALLKAVIEGKVPYAAIQANESFLNAQAKQLKAEMDYPGVRVTKNSVPVSRQ